MGEKSELKANKQFPVYIVWDEIENKLLIDDAGVTEVSKTLGINISSVYYALIHESLVHKRYSVREDVISLEQLDEWDRYCNKLKASTKPGILSKIRIKLHPNPLLEVVK